MMGPVRFAGRAQERPERVVNFYLNHGVGGIQLGRSATDEKPFALHHFDTGNEALAEFHRAIAPLPWVGFPIWPIRPIALEIADRVP
jgi:hypothetical protein